MLKVRCSPAVTKVTLTDVQLITTQTTSCFIGYWYRLPSIWLAITWAINFCSDWSVPAHLPLDVHVFNHGMSEWELSTAAASISNSDTHVHAISVRFMSCSAMLTIRFYLSARQMLQWSNLKLKDRDVSHNSAVCPTLLLQNKNCTKLWGVWGYVRILPEFDYWTWIFIPLGIYSLLRLRNSISRIRSQWNTAKNESTQDNNVLSSSKWTEKSGTFHTVW